MITFFTRKELFLTYNVEEMMRIRNVLHDNNIEYHVKVGSRDFWSRGRTGSFGINQNCNYEYKFYVKKPDYEKALYLIHKNP